MLSIAEMEAHITQHLCGSEDGYAKGIWRTGARSDTGASSRINVYSITFHNMGSPRVPSNVCSLVCREGWLLCGGMEHGNQEIEARVHVIDGSGRLLHHTEVKTLSDLQAYLDTHVPTGDTLRKLVASEKAAADEAVRAYVLTTRRHMIVDSCVVDSGVSHLVSAVLDALQLKVDVDGGPLRLTPTLRERLVERTALEVTRALGIALEQAEYKKSGHAV
jgi:hypothetical protein